MVDVYGSDYKTKLEGKLEQLNEQIRAEAADDLESLGNFNERIMAIVSFDPTAPRAIRRRFANAARQLGDEAVLGDGSLEESTLKDAPDAFKNIPETTVSEHIHNAENGVRNWSGDAADAFRQKFVASFLDGGETLKYQRLLLNYLQMAAHAEQALYRQTRKDIWEAVDKAITLADGINDECDCTASGFTVGMTMAAAVGTVSAAVLPVAGALVAAIGAVGAAYGGMSGDETEDAEERGSITFEFSNGSMEQLYYQIGDFLNKVEEHFADQADMISGALKSLSEYMVAGGQSKLVGPEILSHKHSDGHAYGPLSYGDDGEASVNDEYLEEFGPKSQG